MYTYVIIEVNQSYSWNKWHDHKFLGSCELKAPLYIYICQHIGQWLLSQHVDQASFEIMVNISQHDNHVSQQTPADMSTA